MRQVEIPMSVPATKEMRSLERIDTIAHDNLKTVLLRILLDPRKEADGRSVGVFFKAGTIQGSRREHSYNVTYSHGGSDKLPDIRTLRVT